MKKVMLSLLTLFFAFNIINADEISPVAKIGETEYSTLDEAIEKANDNDTITLLNDAYSKGINLKKNITIDGSNYKITFEDKGIAIWGVKLTFKNATVTFTSVGSTPYTAEWNWMTICASKNSELNLINTNMTLDGTSVAGGVHAIYFTGNDKLDLNNSTLTIKNYPQDALEWDGGDGGYNITLTNSSYLSDNNRSGFTGTFVVKATNSNIDVINSLGNGSNGSHFEFTKSKVNFNNNKSHGLSAGNLIIDNSTVNANGNGANGVHVTGKLEVKNNSTLTIQNNDCSISSQWTIPGALYVKTGGTIESSTKLTITDNNGSGIYVDTPATLNLNTGIITRNIANKLEIGGGINNHGTINISEGVEIYNNKANQYADDIYSNGKINLPKVVENKNLLKKRNDGLILNNCEDEINGWYNDSDNSRWEAHAENEADNYIKLVESNKYESELSIKAAHNITGKVIAKYIDNFGNVIAEEIITIDEVGKTYKTSALDITDYKLIEIEGEESGKYTIKDIIVTYIYEFDGGKGEGDPDIPATGIKDNFTTEILSSLSFITLATSIIIKKKFF